MPSFVGGDTGGGNVTTLTGVSWPGGVQADDVAVLMWGTSSGAPVNTPSGFTLIDDYTANSGTHETSLFYRICNGSESGALSLVDGSANQQSACLWVGRGFHPTNPIDGFSRFDETVSQTTHDCPSYTLVAANCGILVCVSERNTNGTNDWTPPTGFDSNELDTQALAFGTGGTCTAVASDDLNTARVASAVVDPGNWTSANAFASLSAVTYTLALVPDVAPPPDLTFVRPMTTPRGAGFRG